MRKLTLKEWEEKYVTGRIERFDQKYWVSSRLSWDPEMRQASKGIGAIGVGEVKDKPGYALEDLALRWASREGTYLEVLNTDKPNPGSLARAIKDTREALNQRVGPTAFQPPERVKLDVSDPEQLTRKVKKVATYFGADRVGICKLDHRWVYSHTYEGEGTYRAGDTGGNTGESKPQEVPKAFQYAVVMVFEEEYDMIKYYPSYIDNAAACMGYSRMAFTNLLFSAFIRNLGFKVINCTTNDVAMSIPMAMQAGLGELGRNGLLITPQFGPRVRISKVMTDLPLTPDAPVEFGVTEFCNACKKCAEMCPSQAILLGDRTAERHNLSNSGGVLKWPINSEKCRSYWARIHKSCTICMASCPYNKPYTRLHRSVRWLTDHLRWADVLYVKTDDWFGFGKPKKPDRFWEEWQPRRR